MPKLCEVFDISYGTKLDYKLLQHENNGISYVSRQSKNNGVKDYVAKYKNIEPIKAGAITVALGGAYVLASFLQTKDFYTGQNIAVLTPINKDMTDNEKLFYCMCIEYNRYKFSAFGREANSHISSLIIPSLEYVRNKLSQYVCHQNILEEIPKFYYEDGYDSACWYIDNVNNDFEENYKKSISENKMDLRVNKWQSFLLSEYFNIYTGKDFLLKNVIIGDKYSITSHKITNNSVAKCTNDVLNQKLFDCNKSLSVSDRGHFEATVQQKDFYIGTRVKAVEKKTETNKYVLAFIMCIINKEKFRYEYGRNCCDKFESMIIKLPAKQVGTDENNKSIYEPDWQFMEDYIKSLPYSVNL